MVIHSVPVVVLASVSGLVGIFFLALFLRKREDQIGGSFALVCLSIVLYDIGCIGLYNSGGFETSAEWQRLQFASIALLTVTLCFFYNRMTGRLSKKTLVFITILNAGFIIFGYAVQNHLTLTPAVPAEKFITIGKFLNIRYLEVQPGIVYDIQVFASLVVYTICIFGLISFQRSAGHGKKWVVVAIILFYFAGINDSLVGLGIYPFIYLFEYAFAGLIVSMAGILISDFLNLHDEVKNMNAGLEIAVAERTKELKALSGLLPICSECKKIRDDRGYWNRLESYIEDHSDVDFSHGICPECAKRLYPDIDL